jgi:hypothetical protein
LSGIKIEPSWCNENDDKHDIISPDLETRTYSFLH